MGVPTFKWEEINMDFIVGLFHTRRKKDSIFVILDRLTISTNSIPIKSTFMAKDCARYIDENVSLHGILLYIISDRGAQFSSDFLRSFKKGVGTN